jgi:mono/diheme cytochrome c family protein
MLDRKFCNHKPTLSRLTSAVIVSFICLIAFAGMQGAESKQNAARPASKSVPQKPASQTAGQQVYQKQCVGCHGAKGEGAKVVPEPLAGSRSVGELARFISKTMPPGPRKCAPADALKVAAYVYNAFYSPLAQARNKTARIELARLTVRQYRNAVTDLLANFRAPAQSGPPAKREAKQEIQETQHGLLAEYFKAKRFQGDERVLQRTDPEVQFDWGQAGPVPEQFDPHQFSIRWSGGVLAPDTGEYEFVVRSDHAVRLWVNDPKQPLIDAWVKSGNDTEFRGTIFLIGGRAYPLRLEFTKSTQGVDDTDKQKGKPIAKAFLTLAWKRPKMADETIPQRCLLPMSLPEMFAPAAPFPPDDRSIGYERGTSVSKAWDDATTSAALETAAYVVAHLKELSDVPETAPDRRVRLQAFCRQFVERALRRPLSEADAKFYVVRQFAATPDVETAIKRVVLLTLKSPRFLYREIGAPDDAYDTSARLAFGLWDTLPDAELLKAASSGSLVTREQVRMQAERMVTDPRAWPKLREFLLQWLKVDQVPDIAKDARHYPGFDANAQNDLRTSLEMFLENTVWSDKSDFRELMLTDKLYLNGRLAKLYGVALPADAPFQPVSLDPAERSGVLTHPYVMASFAYVDGSSPIHRGVLVARNMLGRTLQPPPAAFVPLAAALHPDLTTRQRVAMQTRPAACSGCHGLINPLGFTMERFDAIGRLRVSEQGKPIDATGSYRSRTGKLVTFMGARDLGRFVADSPEAHAAFVEKLFQYLVKQPVRAYGPQTLPDLQRYFETHDYNIRKLMVEIMAQSALPNSPPRG